MPYVPSKKTDGKSTDREVLDVAVEQLAQTIARERVDNIQNLSLKRAYQKSFSDIGDVLTELLNGWYESRYIKDTPEASLARTIYDIGLTYGYEGAYLGELNYAITRLIQRVPQIKVALGDWNDEFRYWVYAATASALIYASRRYFEKDDDRWALGGVFGDIKDEYKRRVNTAYEAAQIVKSGDCYNTPYYTRLAGVVDEAGKLIGSVEIMLKRDPTTLNIDTLPFNIVVKK